MTMEQNIYKVGVLMLTLFVLSGCATKSVQENVQAEKKNDVNAISYPVANKDMLDESTETLEEIIEPIAPVETEIDIDLTRLNQLMAYAEMENIMMIPWDYIGKTIKMNGPYYASFSEETGLYYNYILITDPLACCQGGIEFVWDQNTHVFPDDYPEEGENIEIYGKFGSYEELGLTYYCIFVEDLIIMP